MTGADVAAGAEAQAVVSHLAGTRAKAQDVSSAARRVTSPENAPIRYLMFDS